MRWFNLLCGRDIGRCPLFSHWKPEYDKRGKTDR